MGADEDVDLVVVVTRLGILVDSVPYDATCCGLDTGEILVLAAVKFVPRIPYDDEADKLEFAIAPFLDLPFIAERVDKVA